MAEFTGERVIPGEVDPDLWNEHRSRYLFAARLCRNKRVLDVGCGTGYGAGDLARPAASVIGLDVAEEAVRYARQHYGRPNLAFLQASATALPLRDGTIDLVVAFEIIEHVDDWASLLRESRRVLAPGGQFIVSTPNKDFYSESRRLSGPNPYHRHEFDFEEFQRELTNHFSHVSFFLQNHGPSIIFQPSGPATGTEASVETQTAKPEESNFFIAVCAASPQTGAPTFVHVPSTANVLRERGQHIELLEDELRKKDAWLEKAKQEHAELLERFRTLEQELEERNQWAEQLNAELEEARRRLDELHATQDAAIAEISTGYEEKIASLERESESQSRWAMKTQQELETKSRELARCVDVLHQTEKDLQERTAWAQSLDARVQELEARVAVMEASRWVRLGRAFGLGPGVPRK